MVGSSSKIQTLWRGQAPNACDPLYHKESTYLVVELVGQQQTTNLLVCFRSWALKLELHGKALPKMRCLSSTRAFLCRLARKPRNGWVNHLVLQCSS